MKHAEIVQVAYDFPTYIRFMHFVQNRIKGRKIAIQLSTITNIFVQ
jgi:hypothetical protein